MVNKGELISSFGEFDTKEIEKKNLTISIITLFGVFLFFSILLGPIYFDDSVSPSLGLFAPVIFISLISFLVVFIQYRTYKNSSNISKVSFYSQGLEVMLLEMFRWRVTISFASSYFYFFKDILSVQVKENTFSITTKPNKLLPTKTITSMELSQEDLAKIKEEFEQHGVKITDE